MQPIPLERFRSLPSTSDLAQEWLRAGKVPPFAVMADSQTQGRGRRGHSWLSPEGNLYLSLALELAQLGVQALLPLRVALLLALWLEQVCQLTVTLKWPNDLYFKGRKLAGLLCEASARAEGRLELVVGLGLNVCVGPALAGSYRAVCLEEIRPLPTSLPCLARSLLDFWQQTWEHLPWDGASLVAASAPFRQGVALWQREGRFYRELGLDAEGRLWLQPLALADGAAVSDHPAAEPPVCLSSAHHDFLYVDPVWVTDAADPLAAVGGTHS